MSTPSELVIENWNRSFRPWSENYIKQYKSAILGNCLFENEELRKGHSSALRDIEKNKGNIVQFVLENTEQKYSHMLPSKILSDTYSFMQNRKKAYKMVYRSVISQFISWKPGTTNALSKQGLQVHYGNEHFVCKFRKYQLESMKKFIQATPGTKEIRGQWAANLANDSMMVSFGNNSDVILVLKIGCFYDKLHIMYEENGVLRKNSKIRKQTLKTSCWGLEKTKISAKFDNSIIIQENYAIDLFAHNILSISPIIVYVCKRRMNHLHGNTLRINNLIVNLNKRPFHIENIAIASLNNEQEQNLRRKYRNVLLNIKGSKGMKPSKPKAIKKKIVKKEESDEDSDFCPVKPKKMDNENDENDSNDSEWYTTKPYHKKYGHVNDSTSLISTIPATKETATPTPSFMTSNTPYGFTPQHPAYDANMNFTDTPMGDTMGFNATDNPLLIAPHTFDSAPNMPPIINNNLNDDSMNWNSFDTPINTLHPMNSYASLHSMNSEFIHNLDNFNQINRTLHPMNSLDMDMELDLHDNMHMNANTNNYPPFIDHSNNHNNNMHPMNPPFMNMNHMQNNSSNNNPRSVDEMQQLRQQNELLLRRVTEQQQQIEFLASQIGAIHSNNYYHRQAHNPLKRRRISAEALLPPAA